MKQYRQFIEILILSVIVFIIFLLAIIFLASSQSSYEKLRSDCKSPLDKGDLGDYEEVSNFPRPLYQGGSFSERADLKNIKMFFFGDMMIDRHVGEKIATNGLPYLFDKLATSTGIDFNSYDLISANLEGATTDGGEHYLPNNVYDFAFNPDLINKLKNYNFNFFNLANNHLTDQGQKGVEETRKNLSLLNFKYSGCSDGLAGECSATTTEINNLQVGLAGFSMVYNLIDKKEITDIVSDLASSTDLVIVNMHWGVEYEHQFNKIQEDYAHAIIDSGADIIIGHHPHVVQGFEVYKNKPIFYSLGNFIFDQYFSPDTQEGLGVGIGISENKKQIFLFPFRSKLNQVELMKDEEKSNFYKKFIQWSNVDESLKNEISQGFLEL